MDVLQLLATDRASVEVVTTSRTLLMSLILLFSASLYVLLIWTLFNPEDIRFYLYMCVRGFKHGKKRISYNDTVCFVLFCCSI